jgi:lysozyme
VTPRARVVAAIGASATAIVLAVLPQAESSGRQILTPYRDTGGVWTVCDGVTGPAVIPGRKYSIDECKDLNAIALVPHAEAVARCVRPPMSPQRAAGLTLFAYNVGVQGFCSSNLVRRLNAGDPRACEDITTRWYRAGGKDCRDPASKCRGVIERRKLERQLCEAAP